MVQKTRGHYKRVTQNQAKSIEDKTRQIIIINKKLEYLINWIRANRKEFKIILPDRVERIIKK